MDKVHLREAELACSGDGKADVSAGVAKHLRWCTRCRSAAAEYRWLKERVVDALAATADAIPVPLPQWQAVKRRLLAGRQRRIAGWRASAAVSVALAICVILSVSSMVGVTVAAQVSSPEVVMTPALVTTAISSDRATSGATPTPISACESVESPSTPVLVAHPTPPQSDA